MSRKNSPVRNSKNLLSGITPTIAGFSVDPGTIAEMVTEQFDSILSQFGTTLDAFATITYDLGREYRVIGFTDNEFDDINMYGSLDDIVYNQLSNANCVQFAGVYRYFKLSFGIHAQIRYIKNVVYEV